MSILYITIIIFSLINLVCCQWSELPEHWGGSIKFNEDTCDVSSVVNVRWRPPNVCMPIQGDTGSKVLCDNNDKKTTLRYGDVECANLQSTSTVMTPSSCELNSRSQYKIDLCGSDELSNELNPYSEIGSQLYDIQYHYYSSSECSGNPFEIQYVVSNRCISDSGTTATSKASIVNPDGTVQYSIYYNTETCDTVTTSTIKSYNISLNICTKLTNHISYKLIQSNYKNDVTVPTIPVKDAWSGWVTYSSSSCDDQSAVTMEWYKPGTCQSLSSTRSIISGCNTNTLTQYVRTYDDDSCSNGHININVYPTPSECTSNKNNQYIKRVCGYNNLPAVPTVPNGAQEFPIYLIYYNNNNCNNAIKHEVLKVNTCINSSNNKSIKIIITSTNTITIDQYNTNNCNNNNNIITNKYGIGECVPSFDNNNNNWIKLEAINYVNIIYDL